MRVGRDRDHWERLSWFTAYFIAAHQSKDGKLMTPQMLNKYDEHGNVKEKEKGDSTPVKVKPTDLKNMFGSLPKKKRG